MRALIFLLLTIILSTSAFGYIDPGTGGYLISVIWQYLIAGLAFVSASIIFFFKHKVRELWAKKWVKVLVILMVVLIISVILFFIFKPTPQGGLL